MATAIIVHMTVIDKFDSDACSSCSTDIEDCEEADDSDCDYGSDWDLETLADDDDVDGLIARDLELISDEDLNSSTFFGKNYQVVRHMMVGARSNMHSKNWCLRIEPRYVPHKFRPLVTKLAHREALLSTKMVEKASPSRRLRIASTWMIVMCSLVGTSSMAYFNTFLQLYSLEVDRWQNMRFEKYSVLGGGTPRRGLSVTTDTEKYYVEILQCMNWMKSDWGRVLGGYRQGVYEVEELR